MVVQWQVNMLTGLLVSDKTFNVLAKDVIERLSPDMQEAFPLHVPESDTGQGKVFTKRFATHLQMLSP